MLKLSSPSLGFKVNQHLRTIGLKDRGRGPDYPIKKESHF